MTNQDLKSLDIINLRKEKYVKDLEKRVNSLTVFVKDIVEIQEKMIERIKALETRVIMMQSQQHVIDIVSNISRQQPMKEVFDE